MIYRPPDGGVDVSSADSSILFFHDGRTFCSGCNFLR